jgi:hypothetical protein
MVSKVRFVITMVAAVLLVGLSTGVGWAGARFTVQIDDLTDTVSLLPIPGLTPGPIILPDSTGEFLHFTLPGAGTSVQAANFFEDFVGGTLSDQLLVTPNSSLNITDVKFASDPSTLILPPGVTLVSLLENGTFQPVFFTNTGAPNFNSYDFQVRSDVVERGDVPAPSTLLLLGSGLTALAGVAARLRRRRPSDSPR